ncbi:MAG: 3-phosphoshikimate 1-carboxyvinyltransferase [Bacillota bacterium]|nr:3-phosphoshikimate 1-carboxyvinyltransferase [Bacillota bacterium]
MNRIISPSLPSGTIESIPSKSHVHRLLICAALSRGKSMIKCRTRSEDIDATADCLSALCADINRKESVFYVDGEKPGSGARPGEKLLKCRESGSTYRFLFPVVCALGEDCTFLPEGRLPERPMEPLFSVLEEKGISIRGKGSGRVSVSGKLKSGKFSIPGDISSQFISGLIFALPLLEGDSVIEITGTVESRKYIDITLAAVRSFGINIYEENNTFKVPGNQKYVTPGSLTAEGDWSNSAFWLCCGALSGKEITCTGLSMNSLQGDKEICSILEKFGAEIKISEDNITVIPGRLKGTEIDASQVPDLVPAIAAVAAGAEGHTVIRNAGRLRLKESDRLKAVSQVLAGLGADIRETEDGLIINGLKIITGGTADSWGDHRIAMMASIVSVICSSDVRITNAQAVNKSYPAFFEDFASLGAVIHTEY